jgi:hypothetical protein
MKYVIISNLGLILGIAALLNKTVWNKTVW